MNLLKVKFSGIPNMYLLMVNSMVKFGSKDKRARLVLISSIATSLVLMNLFLLGTLLVNMYRGEVSYTMVDIAAGSIFVLVITMIISLSLWPRIIDRLESREKKKQ
ncbi:predicted protein [Methanosarcina acetivorans C2A]|jgi:hypothetical protein|uniref:Uncharacterized protein n=3 Tax=Methanosarcina TaxID=2207 RepID=Q8TR41_METAC|nr:predicted protein [Methanosarcina acetivorans C2A]